MGKYTFSVYLAFKSAFMYRMEVFFKIIQSIVVLSVQVFLWKTLYKAGVGNTEIPLKDMITYLILSTGIGIFLLDNSAIWDIGGDVRNGNISVYLSRPLSYMLYKCSQLAGRLFFLFIFNTVPMFVIGICLYGFRFPQKPYQLILSMVIIINSYFVFFLINFLAGISSFWFMEVHGMFPLLLGNLIKVFSGAVVPLWFFPGWLKNVADILPVRLGFDLPLSVYLGKIDGVGILKGFLLQIAWLVVLAIISQFVWRIAFRKLVIQGG